MPTGNMFRIETLVTGVAGSPYYLVGYFDAELNIADDAAQAWHDLVAPGDSSLPLNSIYATQGEAQIISPVTGNAVGIQVVTPRTTTGSRTQQLTPPANQKLIRWRTGEYIGGREVRGRTNLPNLFVDQTTTTGDLTPTTVSGTNGDIDAFLAVENVNHVIWSKKNGVWYETVSGSVWNKPSILRSRRD